MAKVVIAGEAVVVTSAVKLSDLRKIAKYRPDALVLKGGEDGKEPIFRVGVCNGTGKINKYGAEFGSETHDDFRSEGYTRGLATITLVNGGLEGDIREAVAESLGCSILNLNKLEETFPAVLAEIDAEKDAILENITVAQ